jgi:hypothetical protein
MNFGRIYKDINPIFATEDFRIAMAIKCFGTALALRKTSRKKLA